VCPAAAAAATTTTTTINITTNVGEHETHVAGISLKAFSQFLILILFLVIWFWFFSLGFLAANFLFGKYFFKYCFGFLLIGGDMCCR